MKTRYSYKTLYVCSFLSQTNNPSDFQISMVNDFVSKINSALCDQDEVEKVKVVSQRLATCAICDVPIGWEKVLSTSTFFGIVSSSLLQYLQPYIQLDLLAPMQRVNVEQQRALIIEGVLRYREDATKVNLMV